MKEGKVIQMLMSAGLVGIWTFGVINLYYLTASCLNKDYYSVEREPANMNLGKWSMGGLETMQLMEYQRTCFNANSQGSFMCADEFTFGDPEEGKPMYDSFSYKILATCRPFGTYLMINVENLLEPSQLNLFDNDFVKDNLFKDNPLTGEDIRMFEGYKAFLESTKDFYGI